MNRDTKKVINDVYRCDHCNSRPTNKQIENLLQDIIVYHQDDLMLCANCMFKFRNGIFLDDHRWRLFDPNDYDKIKRYDRNKKVN